MAVSCITLLLAVAMSLSCVINHHCVLGQEVTISLGSMTLANNSEVVITDIGDAASGTSPLLCTTPFRPCCSSAANRYGTWYYPNGLEVPNNAGGQNFYRGRSDDGEVRLSRRDTAESPLGTFTCEIPLTSSSELVRLTVRVVSASTEAVTTSASTTQAPTTIPETTEVITTTPAATTEAVTTLPPVTTEAVTTLPPVTTEAVTTVPPVITEAITTISDTTQSPTTVSPTTEVVTTEAGPSVSLFLGTTPLANNSEVEITDIGDIDQGTDLICSTNYRPCCSSAPNRYGNWYYPDGTAVPNNAAGEGFYRGRSDDGIVRLSRRNDAASPLGTFTCEIPLTGPTDLVTLSVTVIASATASPSTAATEAQTTDVQMQTTTVQIETTVTEAMTTTVETQTTATEAVTTESPVTTDTLPTVSLSLGTTPLPNNSEVVITDIGDVSQGTDLVCETTYRPCCSSASNRHGDWYYPNGSMVSNEAAGKGFYRGRSDDGIVRLSRRNNTPSPLGTFTCEIPLDSSSSLQILTVRVIEAPMTTEETTQAPSTTETTSATTEESVTLDETTTVFVPDPKLFQLRLTGINNCITWRDSNTVEKASDIIEALVSNVEELCQCQFATSQISQGGFRCFEDSINSVTYRGQVVGDALTSSEQLLTHIEAWVNSDNADIVIQFVILRPDTSCTVEISSLSEAECSLQDGSSSSSVGPIAGGVVGGLLLALLVVLIAIFILVFLRRRKAKYRPALPRGSHDFQSQAVMLNAVSFNNPMHVYDEVPRGNRFRRKSADRKLSVSSIKKEAIRLDLEASNFIVTNPSTGVYEQVDLGGRDAIEGELTTSGRKMKSDPLPQLPDEQEHVPPRVPFVSEYLVPNSNNNLIPNPTYGIAPPGVGPILDPPGTVNQQQQQGVQRDGSLGNDDDNMGGEVPKSNMGDYAVIDIK